MFYASSVAIRIIILFFGATALSHTATAGDDIAWRRCSPPPQQAFLCPLTTRYDALAANPCHHKGNRGTAFVVFEQRTDEMLVYDSQFKSQQEAMRRAAALRQSGANASVFPLPNGGVRPGRPTDELLGKGPVPREGFRHKAIVEAVLCDLPAHYSSVLEKIPGKSFSWRFNDLAFLFDDFRISVNGIDFGTVKPGDYVRIATNGTVLINGQRSQASPRRASTIQGSGSTSAFAPR